MLAMTGKRVAGLLPVYKEAGTRFLDLLDSVRLIMETELNISFKSLNISLNCCPKMRKQDEGVMHLGFGLHARRDLSHLKYGSYVYRVSAVVGQRSPVLARDRDATRPSGQAKVL